MPKVSMTTVTSTRLISKCPHPITLNSQGANSVSSRNHMVMSSSPKPTTTSPMTAPARKATVRPLLRLSLAPWAVRLEAMVAVFIPRKPHNPEKNPPVRKAAKTMRCCAPIRPMTKRMAETTTKNTATTLYWRRRYAMAPSRTCWAISRMFSSPSWAERTCR